MTLSCGSGRPPPQHAGPEAEASLARQERRLEDIDRRLAAQEERLARVEEAVGERRGGASADEGGDGTTERIERLLERLDRLESEIRRAPATGIGGAPRPTRRRPDPAEVYAVPIDGAPFRGRDDAPIAIVRGFEFACPYSHKSRDTMNQLLAAYPDDVKIVYRQFVVHPQTATIPALAACAAHRQGRFADMEEAIWTRGFEAGRDLGRPNMERIATDIGLDLARFRSDMDGSCADAVRKDQAELASLGQGGTPAFWINGRFLSGARPIDAFRALVDDELVKVRQRVGKRGTTRARYYRKWVLARGKKKLD